MKDLVAGGVGGVIFGVLYLALGIPLPFAIAGAGAGYLAGRLIAAKPRETGPGLDFGDDLDGVAAAAAAAEKQVKTLASLTSEIRKPDVRARVAHLAEVAGQIIGNIRENPKDAKRVRQFLNYYLGATITIVQRYAELSSRNVRTPDVVAALTKVEEMLEPIQHAFEQQMAAAAQDEILDLDTELKLLEQTLQMESLNRAK